MGSVFLLFGNIAGSEIIFILIFALLFFGSKSIPGIAKTLAKGMREIQNARAEIAKEMQDSTREMRKDMNEMNPVKQIQKDINEINPAHQIKKTIKENLKGEEGTKEE